MNTEENRLSTLVQELFCFFPESLLAVLQNLLSFPSDFPSILEALVNFEEVTKFFDSYSLIKNSYVNGSAYIGDFTLIRDSYISDGCKIGAHVEINKCIILDDSVIPHHNYIGYSIIGRNVILGGNTRTAVRRLDDKNPSIIIDSQKYTSASKKFGSIVGDNARIGSSVLLNPITILGRNSIIYPNQTVIGYFPRRTLIRNEKIVKGR